MYAHTQSETFKQVLRQLFIGISVCDDNRHLLTDVLQKGKMSGFVKIEITELVL